MGKWFLRRYILSFLESFRGWNEWGVGLGNVRKWLEFKRYKISMVGHLIVHKLKEELTLVVSLWYLMPW